MTFSRLRFFASVLLSSAAVWLACQAASPANSGGTTSLELLLNDADVHKELDISAEQAKKLQQACRAVRAQVLAKYRNYRAPNPTTAQQEADAALKAICEGTEKALKPLLTVEQLDRLLQIDRQQRGLRDPEAQELLKFTRQQRDEIWSIYTRLDADTNQAFKKIRRSDTKAKFAAWRKLRKKAVEKALDVLTADQRKLWEERAGADFELIKFDESTGIPPRLASVNPPPVQPIPWWRVNIGNF